MEISVLDAAFIIILAIIILVIIVMRIEIIVIIITFKLPMQIITFNKSQCPTLLSLSKKSNT